MDKFTNDGNLILCNGENCCVATSPEGLALVLRSLRIAAAFAEAMDSEEHRFVTTAAGKPSKPVSENSSQNGILTVVNIMERDGYRLQIGNYRIYADGSLVLNSKGNPTRARGARKCTNCGQTNGHDARNCKVA